MIPCSIHQMQSCCDSQPSLLCLCGDIGEDEADGNIHPLLVHDPDLVVTSLAMLAHVARIFDKFVKVDKAALDWNSQLELG